MSNHTPGPWSAKVVDAAGPHKKWEIHPYVADIFYETATGEANAKLIAAAPELLAALKYLVDEFEEAVDYIPEYVALTKEAKAAIAKAEGRDE